MCTLIEVLQRFAGTCHVYRLLLRWRQNVREILVLIYRGTLPDISEVHYIDTAVRMTKPTFSKAFIQYFVCIFVFTAPDIRADRHITTFLTLERGHI